MKIITILLPVFVIALFSLRATAQTAEQIDVRFIEITKIGRDGITGFQMRAVNSSQNAVIYTGVDSAAITGIFPFIRCGPCSPPKLFNTNIFRSEMIADLAQESGQVKLYLTSSESSPLYLNQRVLSRKKDFALNGITKIKGRIEITGSNGRIIAVDNDVVLEGGYSILYFKPYWGAGSIGRRYTDFKSLIYTLNAPGN